jgi:hypothetical protein
MYPYSKDYPFNPGSIVDQNCCNGCEIESKACNFESVGDSAEISVDDKIVR